MLFCGNTAQNALKYVENIPESSSFAKPRRIKKGQTYLDLL